MGNSVIPVKIGGALAQKLVDDDLYSIANSFSGVR